MNCRRLISLGLAPVALVLFLGSFGGVSFVQAQDIQLTRIPFDFVSENDEVAVSWVATPAELCSLKLGATPGNYTKLSLPGQPSGFQTVRFVPAEKGLLPRVYYCRVVGSQGSSREFQLVVETSEVPEMISPLGDIENTTPTFTWKTVLGVPYYTILVSDSKIEITENEDGEMTVEGANIIWQAITSESSILYGAEDPSGFFSMDAVPLVPGSSYWWVVLNCYGPNPAYVSGQQSSVSEFHVDLPQTVSPPALVSPADGSLLDEKTISFIWRGVAGALSYKLYIFEVKSEGGSSVNIPIWDDVMATADTVYDFNARLALRQADYVWKVAAMDSAGAEFPSAAWRFSYESPSASVDIHTVEEGGSDLPRVRVSVRAEEGFSQMEPIVTGGDGRYTLESILPGLYWFKGERASYEPDSALIRLYDGNKSSVELVLRPSPGLVSGSVSDENGALLSDVLIVADSPDHAEKRTTTDFMGTFSIGVDPGKWVLRASKPTYEAQYSDTVVIASGEFKTVAFTLEPQSSFVTGMVVNGSGMGISGVSVIFKREGETVTGKTDFSGNFSVPVAPGSWTVRATRSGFIDSKLRVVDVSAGERKRLEPNLVLTSDGGIVSGTVSDGARLVKGAIVEAVPFVGGAYSTTTDAFGKYTLSLPPGTYRLNVAADGYAPNREHMITVESGESWAGVDILLEAATSTLSGVVVDESTGELLGGVVVAACDFTTVSSTDGSFSLRVRPGRHVLEPRVEGYVPSSKPSYVLSEGQTISGIRLAVMPNGSVLSGRIRYLDQPCYLVKVIASSATDSSYVYSDFLGGYSFNLRGGLWTLKVESPFVTAVPRMVSMSDAQTVSGQDMEVSVSSASVSGTVRAEGGGALRGAVVACEQSGLKTSTNMSGQYRLQVPPGSLSLEASREGFKAKSQAVSASSGGTYTLDFNLEELPVLVSGTVLEAGTQQPVASARVCASGICTESGKTGEFDLYLPVGLNTITAQKVGYLPDTLLANLTGELTGVSFSLQPNLGGIAGSVTSQQGPLSGVTVTASSDEFGSSVVTDGAGEFSFADDRGDPILPPGRYTVSVRPAGYVASSQAVEVKAGETAQVQISLQKLAGVIAGTVVDAGSETPVEGATLRAEPSGHPGVEASSAASGSDGGFELASLVDGFWYTVTAVKAGYASAAVESVRAGSPAIRISLLKNSGSIIGKAVDSETLEPLDQGLVTAADGQGHFASAVTDSQGLFALLELPAGSLYTVSLTLDGYEKLTRDSVAAGGDTLTLAATREYGRIQGVVTSTTLRAIEGATVLAVNLNNPASSISALTDSAGSFVLGRVVPGDYIVSAVKAGMISTGTALEAHVMADSTVSDLRFVLEEIVLENIAISGPSSIGNRERARLSVAAQTMTGRSITLNPIWTVSPTGAGVVDSSGTFVPRDDFIGTVSISVRDSAGSVEATHTLSIFLALDPDSSARVTDLEGMVLEISPGAYAEPIRVSLRKPRLAAIRRAGRTYQVVGDVYELSPDGIVFEDSVTLTLPVAAEYRGKHLSIAKYNPRTFSWDPITSQKTGLSIKSSLSGFSQYAVIASSDPLSIRNVVFLPNPFSPVSGVAGRLRIGFDLSSTETAQPIVTIKIYNMAGRLVRKLVEEQATDKSQRAEFFWDGTDDGGRVCLNGRYVIRITVKDGSGQREVLKTAVLIK